MEEKPERIIRKKDYSGYKPFNKANALEDGHYYED